MTAQITDPATLPQHDGRPVPWITRWTNEIVMEPYSLGINPTTGRLYLSLRDGKTEDRLGGTLWQREGISRGGEPQWAQVSTYRQRYAMRKCACQVCGKRITEKPVRFLIPLDGIEHVDEDTAITIQPPTCSECIPLALRLCPHLRKYGYQILKVTGYHLWGIYGEVVFLKEDGQPRRMQTAIGYDTTAYGPNFSMDQVLAKQQAIRLDKWVVEKTHVPERVTA